jgi:hypothetical protein
MPEGVERHLFRCARKASRLRGVRERRVRSGREGLADGEEEEGGVGEDCGMGSPVGRSAIGFVGADSEDILGRSSGADCGKTMSTVRSRWQIVVDMFVLKSEGRCKLC